jgi:hypothetical protein
VNSNDSIVLIPFLNKNVPGRITTGVKAYNGINIYLYSAFTWQFWRHKDRNGVREQWQFCLFRHKKVKFFLCLTKHHAMKTYWGVEVQLHAFLTSALEEVSGQLHAPAALPPVKDLPVPIE